MAYDVFGLENPLIDLLAKVPDSFLDSIGAGKNTMRLIDSSAHHTLLTALKDTTVQAASGGSCANTMLGISQLGGKTAFCGKAGNDNHGRMYVDKLEEGGVTSHVATDGSATGSTIILVTPDASRTMNTFLGACQELKPADLPLEALKQAKMLYITGYLWDSPSQKETVMLALNTAKEADIPIAFSLADPFCVDRHQMDFVNIIQNYASLVFANREEAHALTEQSHTHVAMNMLKEWCDTVVVTLGSSGAIVADSKESVYLDPFPVKAVDTTGAGDAFAAGFLHSYIQGKSLYEAGLQGSAFAAKVIQQVGPRLDGDVPTQLETLIGAHFHH